MLYHSTWNINNSFTEVTCIILHPDCIAGKNEKVPTVLNSTTVSSCHSNKDTERPRYCNKEKEKCNCSDYRYSTQRQGCVIEKHCYEEKKSCDCTEGYKECKLFEIWVGGICVSGMMIDYWW